MSGSHWRVSSLLLFAMAALAGPAVAADPGRLAFRQSGAEYRFDTGVLKGTLHGGGKALGLKPLLHADSSTTVSGAYGIFSPYRLLTADARFGTAGWDWANQAELLPDGAVQVTWRPDGEHPLAMTAIYRWTTPNTLDLLLTVKPRRDLRRFEFFLASYFNGFPASFAYARERPAADAKPGFIEARQADGDWQTFPRDEKAAALFGDGRWSRPPHPVTWRIRSRLAAPLALRRDEKSGLTAVLMAPPEDGFAVSMPYGAEGHRSVYLSLFGRDLKAGEKASARARLVIERNLTDTRAVELYRAYLKE